MSDKLQMPHSKQKRDGEVVRLMNDDGPILVMRGNYTKEEIITAAVAAGVTEENYGYWGRTWHTAEFIQGWYKTVPDGSGEYSSMHHRFDSPRRGSYFASSLYLY